MPELPDLLHVQGKLRQALVGQTVTSARVREPVVMRYAVRGDLQLLVGQPLRDVHRLSHLLVFRFGALDLAVNAMLTGRFRLAEAGARNEGTQAFALGFGPRELRYLDANNMGKAYLIEGGDFRSIPGLQSGGVAVLSDAFTLERFQDLLAHRRDQVRVFLLDKTALDSLGNAYADEVLFEAGLHPKTWCRSLTPDDARRLHAAIVIVLREAVDEVARRDPPTDEKVRDFLKVRLRSVCPRCGARVRKAGVRGMDAYFCPHCQPETRAGLVDWRKTGR